MRYFYSGIQKIIEHHYRNKMGVNIYMFHQVNDDKSRWKDHGVCITAEGFSQFIYTLKSKNCTFLSVDDLNLEIAKTDRAAMITFDDVFEDAYHFAFPLLIENKIPFCVFVSEKLVDTEGYITSEELMELTKESLCTIGFHTKSHLLMRFLTTEQIESEVDCSSLENKIDKDIQYFAFPYGSVYACSQRSIDIIAKGKYLLSFSTIAVPCTPDAIMKHKNFLPRINVNEKNYKILLERNHI
jgi:peptidoglycan/xylan/chitin deacetylase (PgdA/CDA1 family)